MRHVDGPPARIGRLGTRGFGPGFPGRGGLAMSLLIGAGLLGARGLGARLVGMRLGIMRLDISRLGFSRLSLRGPGVRGLGFSRLGIGGFGVRGPGFSSPGISGFGVGRLGFSSPGVGRLDRRRPGPGGLGLSGLGLSGLGPGFRSGLSLPVAGGIFLARLLQRDLLLDGLLLAHRFLTRPFLAGWLAIGGPRRGGPVQP